MLGHKTANVGMSIVEILKYKTTKSEIPNNITSNVLKCQEQSIKHLNV
jgi:hypothetical protein